MGTQDQGPFEEDESTTVQRTAGETSSLSPIYRAVIVGSYLLGAVIGNILVSFPYLIVLEGFFGQGNVPDPIAFVFLLSGTILGAVVIGRATSRYLHARETQHKPGE